MYRLVQDHKSVKSFAGTLQSIYALERICCRPNHRW